MAENRIDVKEEFVALSELVEKEEIIPARELLNKTVIIYRIEFQQGSFGEFAIIETDHGKVRTSSRVLIKQLKQIQHAMQERKLKGVRAALRKRKSSSGRDYYLFE